MEVLGFRCFELQLLIIFEDEKSDRRKECSHFNVLFSLIFRHKLKISLSRRGGTVRPEFTVNCVSNHGCCSF